MKLVSYEFCKNYFTGFVEDGDYYRAFVLYDDDRFEFKRGYLKDFFKGSEHFADVIGKFNPYSFFLKYPFELSELTFSQLLKLHEG